MVQEVRIANRTGFCYGVREAIDKAKESAAAGKPTHTLGPGRPQRGRHPRPPAGSASAAWTRSTTWTSGAAVVIRAHGVKPEVFERAEARGLEVIDGTCTWVIQEQRQLQELVDEGYTIVLLGTPKHPEVVGLLGFAPDAIVVDEEEDWDRIPRRKRMALITQSTQPPWKFEKLAAFMVSRAHELKIVNTVCPVTIRRQEDTLETAREVDLMVVVGGRHSANTKELTRLCQIAGTPAIQIENARDLTDPAPFERAPGRGRDRRHVHARSRTCARSREHIFELAGTPRPAARAAELAARRARRRRHARRPHHLAAARRPSPAGVGLTPMAAPLRPACRSSPSSGGPTSARARCSTASWATRAPPSWRTAPAPPATACTATPSGTAAGSWSWTPAASRSRPGDPIEEQVQLQARLAISEADVIVFLVDAETGPTPADAGRGRAAAPDHEARAGRRQQGRQREARAGRRRVLPARLGGHVRDLGQPRARRRGPARRGRVGAAARERGGDRAQGARGRGRGVGQGDGRGRASSRTSSGTPRTRTTTRTATTTTSRRGSTEDDVRALGRRHGGRERRAAGDRVRRAARTSASRRLLNALAGRGADDRVGACPGTTRDAIDTTIAWGRSEIVLIDTAGIRRRGKVASGPAAEKYSTMRALKAISRADVAVLVLDAHDGLTAQDAHVAGYVIEEGRGLVIAVNKWDIVEDKTHKSFDEFVATLRRELPFIDYAPDRVHQRQDRPARPDACWSWRWTCGASAASASRTGELNRLVAAGRGAQRRRRSSTASAPKIRYATQAGVAPPTFVFFATDPAVDPLLVPAVPREPAARGVRLRRHADPAGVPRADPREAGAEGPGVAREAVAGCCDAPPSHCAAEPLRRLRPPRVAPEGKSIWVQRRAFLSKGTNRRAPRTPARISDPFFPSRATIRLSAAKSIPGAAKPPSYKARLSAAWCTAPHGRARD